MQLIIKYRIINSLKTFIILLYIEKLIENGIYNGIDYSENIKKYINDSNGWYFMDTSGWYPASEWQKINGSWYYFDGSGYMVTSRYIDGYWIGSDGVCK